MCYGRTIRSKLPSIEDIETTPPSSDYRDLDKINKEKGKIREDQRRHAQESDIQRGDTVLMENRLPSNKLATTFNKTKYTVLERAGSRATVEDQDTGKTYERNIVHFKRFRVPPSEAAGSGEVETLPSTNRNLLAPGTSITTAGRSQVEDQAAEDISTSITTEASDENFQGFNNEELNDNQRTRRLPPRFNDFVM